MELSTTIFLVLSILFLSTFIRSALGFGDALIAMPLLAMVVGLQVATPLVAMGASTIAFTILLKSWRKVEIKAAWRLVISTWIGIPIGIFFPRGLLTFFPKMFPGELNNPFTLLIHERSQLLVIQIQNHESGA